MFWRSNNIQRVAYFTLLTITLILGLLSMFAILIKEKQRNVFQASNKSALSRSINDYIEIKHLQLTQTLQDYTFWDETVDFVEKKNINWAIENLDPILKTYRLQAIWVLDTIQNKVYTALDSLYPSLINLPVDKKIFKDLYNSRNVITYSLIGNSLVEIVGTTIHPTDDPEKKTSPKGFMFLARVWNPAYLKEFSNITNTKLEITNDTVSNYQTSENETVITRKFYSSDRKFVTQLVARNPSDALVLFNHFSRVFIIILICASLLLLIAFLYTSTKYINKPLTIIEDALKNSNIRHLYKLEKTSAEFSEIGKLIKTFLEQREELIVAKEKAEESERLKSAFLANMSHEIRSPLNGIMGFSDLLSENEIDVEKTRLYSRYISGRSKDLLRIINDILDFSRIEAQQLEIISTQFNLNKLVSELSDLYSLNSKANLSAGIVLLFKRGEDITITADYLRLKQILINLIDNAIKFTEKGKIETSFVVRNNEVEITVADTGIGIPEEKINLIFNRFTQISDPSLNYHRGNGLGLAICKGLVELMHGKIWAESKSGSGSTFHVSLPINPS